MTILPRVKNRRGHCQKTARGWFILSETEGWFILSEKKQRKKSLSLFFVKKVN